MGRIAADAARDLRRGGRIPRAVRRAVRRALRRPIRRGNARQSESTRAPVSPKRVEAASRVDDALLSRKLASNDFFGGWVPEDVEWFSRYLVPPVAPQPGLIVDWLGVKTEARHHPWLDGASMTGVVASGVPIPDDGVHAEAIEYAALLTAVERAKTRAADQFVVVELGASYGPWATAAATLARRAGFSKLVMIGVEASASGPTEILAHAALNGLVPGEDVQIRALHFAVSPRDGSLFFPRVDTGRDNGAQVTDTPGASDYRGVEVEYDEVPAISLESILTDLPRVDFLHMDLQGTEQVLLEDEQFVSVLSGKVATLFLATQSRLIEGIALVKLSAAGWTLTRERPTVFAQNPRTGDPNGWTLRDGGQLWLNARYQ